jgi:hypothetical protein
MIFFVIFTYSLKKKDAQQGKVVLSCGLHLFS